MRCRLKTDVVGPTLQGVGGAISGQVVLGAIRKQAKQVMDSKSVCTTLHGLCISSCPA